VITVDHGHGHDDDYDHHRMLRLGAQRDHGKADLSELAPSFSTLAAGSGAYLSYLPPYLLIARAPSAAAAPALTRNRYTEFSVST
jgi:hypothetical protein